MAQHYSFDENGNEIPPVPKTVSEINEYIRSLIEEEMLIQDIYVVGEISNFKNHIATGHFYFTIKDQRSELKAVMFRTYAQRVGFKLENGMKVLLHGRIGVYTNNGTYQLYVDSMQPDGVGSLYLAYEQLKARLEKLGYFDLEHKRQLPKFPNTIGIITSSTGAAVRDIINVATRRCPSTKLILFPALVQGSDAPADLIRGVEYFNATNSCDVIIIGRGGGSIEDLWAFNDEGLARAIFKSKIPVISAVGHETDFTICDFVADLRAPTPSAAAELATPDLNKFKEKIININNYLSNALLSNIHSCRDKLDSIKSNKIFKKPLTMLDMPQMRLSMASDGFMTTFSGAIKEKRNKFSNINTRLLALNPMSVLSRGYGAIFDCDNKVIKTINAVEKNDKIKIVLSDGYIDASVCDKERRNG